MTFETLDNTELLVSRSLQEDITSLPILALPQSHGRYIIDTEAHDEQSDCVLLQQQLDGLDQPISYWPQSINAAAWAYNTTHREFLAVVWTILLLQPQMEGTNFVTQTDKKRRQVDTQYGVCIQENRQMASQALKILHVKSFTVLVLNNRQSTHYRDLPL